ncbi:YggS family pyridoxal phosphate-dependent enzyme [Acidaminobacterium chupaoyuni]
MVEQAYRQMEERIAQIRGQMEDAAREAGRDLWEIRLMAASKTQALETVAASAKMPIDLFGENRVQELVEKTDAQVYGGKEVHLIGHLQSNKVKHTVGRASVIESVDSAALAKEIARQAAKRQLCQKVMIEVNTGGEESKFGIKPEEIWKLLEEIETMENIKVCGLMTIPPVSQKKGQNRPYFSILRQLFIDIKSKKYDNVSMDILSMGMSRDFCDAIAEGSTLVRIGTGIYGPRIYKEEQK